MEEILFFDYNEKSSVLLIFFFNAVVFSYLLLKNGIDQNKKHSKWLATFIFLGGLYLCPFMLGYAGWYSNSGYPEFMFFVPFQQLFLIGPVFFFYVKTLLNPNLKFIRKDLIHFVPAIVYMIYSIIVFIGDKLIFDELYFYADGRDKDLDFWYQMAGLISMLFYLFLSLKYYFNYRKVSVQEVSFADEVAFKWIKHFAIAFSLILILRVLFFILNPEWGQFGSKYWYYLCFAILLMYISIAGYSNTMKTSPKLGAKLRLEFDSEESKDEPKATNGLDSSIIDAWKDKIIKLFEVDKMHMDPNLTLTDLAEQLDTNRNIISKVINQEFKMNLNDFVNVKRVETVIEKLSAGEHVNSTLLGIALDSGFNSKATFNRAFKKHTGVTPKQFIVKNQL